MYQNNKNNAIAPQIWKLSYTAYRRGIRRNISSIREYHFGGWHPLLLPSTRSFRAHQPSVLYCPLRHHSPHNVGRTPTSAMKRYHCACWDTQPLFKADWAKWKNELRACAWGHPHERFTARLASSLSLRLCNGDIWTVQPAKRCSLSLCDGLIYKRPGVPVNYRCIHCRWTNRARASQILQPLEPFWSQWIWVWKWGED